MRRLHSTKLDTRFGQRLSVVKATDGRPDKGHAHDNVTRMEFRLSATPSKLPGPWNSIDRENAVSTRRRDLVGGASALALLAGSSAAFAQGKEAPAEQRAKSAAGSGTGGGITIQGGSLARPANQEELKALLQAACHNGGGIAFDGSTPPIKISGTLEIRLPDVGDGGGYLNGNGLRLGTTTPDGVTAAARVLWKT